MKKVLISANTLEIGGIEKSLINLLNYLSDEFKIDLVLEKITGELINKVPKDINIIELKVSDFKIPFIRKFINFTRKLMWKFRYNNYDASICYATYSYSANKLARISSKNNILFIHSDYTKIYDKIDLKHFFDTRYINSFKKIIFVSNEMKQNLLKYYPNIEKKSYVINNLINCDEIITCSKEKLNIKFEKNNINLLFVGRLEEESKNIFLQLELIKRLKDKYDNVRLYIIGVGKDEERYLSYIDKNKLNKYVKLLGYKENPYPYIKNCDYILLTSNYEGFPVIFNEALVLKKTVISTIKISDDTINIGDNFGILVSNNINKLVEEMKEIIDSNKQNILDIDIKKINEKRIRILVGVINE